MTCTLRLPGKYTYEEYVNRAAEEYNARIRAATGLNTRVPFFDATDGTMLSGFVEGDTMYEERFERDSESPARVALTLQQVHRLGPVSKSRFDLFSMIESSHRAPSLLPAPRQRGA